MSASLPHNLFLNALKAMSAPQELAARNLLTLIDIISTQTTKSQDGNQQLSEKAMSLLSEASKTRTLEGLSQLQNQWAEAVLHYSQDQTKMGMQFLEHCGQQALGMASGLSHLARPASLGPVNSSKNANNEPQDKP
jgi:hypothetical protein